MRKSAVLVVVLAVMASLSACTASTAPIAGCTPTAPGTASDAVKVSGSFGAKPTVSIPAPLKSTVTERTVLTAGSGKVVKAGGHVNIEYSVFNGTSGQAIGASGYAGSPEQVTVDTTSVLPGMVKMLECSTVGSRVVAVIPPADGFGSAGSSTVGVGATDTIVFVADIVSIPATPLPRATGTAQAPQAGFPTVVLDAKGVPTVTIPKAPAPKKIGIEVLIKGDGAVVPASASVTVNYQGLVWATGKVFDDSWSRGTPAIFNIGQVVEGFKQAIEGQTVGSQIVVTIPPELGYGTAGNSSAGIKGTDTLVFVIDILGF